MEDDTFRLIDNHAAAPADASFGMILRSIIFSESRYPLFRIML